MEIIKTSVLKKNIKKMNKIELEHVTSFFYKNYKNFSIKNFSAKKKLVNMKLSIDTKKDLYLILKVYLKRIQVNTQTAVFLSFLPIVT